MFRYNGQCNVDRVHLADHSYRFVQIDQLSGRIYWYRLCIISRMPEEVLFKSESDQSREEIASYLRKVADNLDSGDAISLKAGSESVTLNPPARPTFEVKAEREGPAGNMTEQSIEFELEWDENDEEGSGGGQLEIE